VADLESGSLVRHATLGVGKIVASEPNAVHVFFPGAGTRFATKLRLPAVRSLLRTEGVQPDAWLLGLSAFALDSKEGRYALGASWMTQEEAQERFLSQYPGGFGSATFRAASWRAAQEGWASAFAEGRGGALVATGDLAEVARRVFKIEKLGATFAGADVGAVKAALAEPEPAGAFLAALFELVGVPSPGRARFDKLFAAARGLPVEPAQQWYVATLFPLLAAPSRHVVLRPKLACDAAERLGCDLRFEPAPSWGTYAALRAFSAQLLERLRPLGATDFVDVDGFLCAIATAKRKAKGKTR
jgi:hypothetical protein